MLRHTRFAALAVTLIVSEALAQEEAPPPPPIPTVKKPLPDLPKNVFAPAPCVCTTWEARFAEYDRGDAEFTKKNQEFTRRATDVKKALDHPDRKMTIPQMKAEMTAITRLHAECKAIHLKLLAETKAIGAEIKAHDAKYGKGISHQAVNEESRTKVVKK